MVIYMMWMEAYKSYDLTLKMILSAILFTFKCFSYIKSSEVLLFFFSPPLPSLSYLFYLLMSFSYLPHATYLMYSGMEKKICME